MGSAHCGIPKPDPPTIRVKVRRNWGLEYLERRGKTVTRWGGGMQRRYNFTTEAEAKAKFENLKTHQD